MSLTNRYHIHHQSSTQLRAWRGQIPLERWRQTEARLRRMVAGEAARDVHGIFDRSGWLMPYLAQGLARCRGCGCGAARSTFGRVSSDASYVK